MFPTLLARFDGASTPDLRIDDAVILRRLADRDPWLRFRKPRYQLHLIKDLALLLPPGPCRILDIGAGSGLIGEIIATLMPGKTVIGVDVAARALPGLRIPLVRFDGRQLPFPDRSFDCALFCNSLHHVPPPVRPALLREALRVTGGGSLVIKDHLVAAPLDRLRLWALDFLGNAPRGAMVSAEYLAAQQWDDLLSEVRCAGERLPVSAYRVGLWNWCFPSRLEACFRVRRAASV